MKRRRLWKGFRHRATVSKALPAVQDKEPVSDSVWLNDTVRTVCPALTQFMLDRTFKVTGVMRVPSTGQYELQLSDVSNLSVAYCFSEQVISTSNDQGKTEPGPTSLNYRIFKGAVRRQAREQLGSREHIEHVVLGHLMEAGSVFAGMLELTIRLPAPAVMLLGPASASSVADMDESNEGQAVALAQCRTEVDQAQCICVTVHAEAPSRYTLLFAQRHGPDWQVQYMDALPQPSANSLAKATTVLTKLGLGQCPAPSNRRFQQDGWSCGLWRIQLMEESLRQYRGEPLHIKPVSLRELATRVNKFIQSINDIAVPLPPVPAAPLPAVPVPIAGPPATSEFTPEDALLAAQSCSKCRQKGCTHCMKQWFAPRRLYSGSAASLTGCSTE